MLSMSKNAKAALVPRLRFPEFRDSGEWKEKEMNDIFDFQDGVAFSPNDFITNTLGGNLIQVVRITDINNKNCNTDKVYVSKDFSEGKELLKYTVQKGDLLLSLTGAAGFNFFIWNSEMAILNQRTLKIIPKNNGDVSLKILLEPLINKKINANGTGQNNNLSKEDLKRTLVTIPPDSGEQQKIADCLSSLDDLITAQTEKIETLKLHKKGLMQGLFPTSEEAHA